jgi:hypothetical protein
MKLPDPVLRTLAVVVAFLAVALIVPCGQCGALLAETPTKGHSASAVTEQAHDEPHDDGALPQSDDERPLVELLSIDTETRDPDAIESPFDGTSSPWVDTDSDFDSLPNEPEEGSTGGFGQPGRRSMMGPGGMGPPGMSPGGGGMGPGGGGAPGYSMTWSPARAVRDTAHDLAILRQSLSLGAPLWTNGSDMLMANVRVANMAIDTGASLPDSGIAMPDELWSVNVGLNYMRALENGWMVGTMVGVGSASDRPFHSIREMTFNLMGFLMMPARNERDMWRFSLMYMYGGPANFPIPGVAYVWRKSDDLTLTIGLPFSVDWRPRDRWSLSLIYMPLNNVTARATWTASEQLSAYTGYEILNESFFLADRIDSRDRLFSVEQRLVSGVVWSLGPNAAVELNGGYSFGRYFAQGTNQWASLTDRLDVRPGPFAGLSLRLSR